MAPATEVRLSMPLHKRQSDCPILFPVDCGDGYCCGATSTCVDSRGSTRCALSGGPVDVPAVPGATTPSTSEQSQEMRCHRFPCERDQVLIIVFAHSPVDNHFFQHVTFNQRPNINSTVTHHNSTFSARNGLRTGRRGSHRVIHRRDHGYPIHHLHPDVVSPEEAATI